MRKRSVLVIAFALLGRAVVLSAEPAGSPASGEVAHRVRSEGSDCLPLRATLWSSPGDRSKPCARSAEAPVERVPLLSAGDGASDGTSRRGYLPVLFSLLVPGAGELYMGYTVRGSVLLAAEAVAWTGYAYYHDKGLDSRAEYERFADAHWSYDRWIDAHALWRDPDYASVGRTFEALDSIGSAYWDGWPPYHTWHSKEEEKQNYYENIGKYDWFISGWEDWDPDAQPRESALRTTYRGMRKKSNDELDKATSFVYLSVAARVISFVETLLLARRDDGAVGGEGQGSSFSIEAHATGLSAAELAFVRRF